MKKTSLFLSLLFFPNLAFGQVGSLQDLLAAFKPTINYLVVIIITLALLFFLWGMAVFILNAGSEDKRAEGKQKMIWGIIILTVMVGVWGIVQIIQVAFFGSNALPDWPGF